jgi:hypothetical protein
MTATVLGQIVIIEAPDNPALPVMVLTIGCDRCGEHAFVIALHHARGLKSAIEQLLANLPPELEKVAETRDTTLAMTTPPRPEDN